MATNLSINKWRGLKILFFGLLLALLGFALSWFSISSIGGLIFFLGWLIGVAGLALHFRQVYREMTEKRENLFPSAKQPWER